MLSIVADSGNGKQKVRISLADNYHFWASFAQIKVINFGRLVTFETANGV